VLVVVAVRRLPLDSGLGDYAVGVPARMLARERDIVMPGVFGRLRAAEDECACRASECQRSVVYAVDDGPCRVDDYAGNPRIGRAGGPEQRCRKESGQPWGIW